MLAFMAQYALTFLQMRSFTKVYQEIRLEGYRAAIGRFSGAFHAGAIVMFGIDEDGVIKRGTAMQGVTVFARFKDFNQFNELNVETITETIPEGVKLSYSLTKAVLDCEQNYRTIMRGEEVPVPPSPLKKAGNLLISCGQKVTGLFHSGKIQI